MKIGLSANTLRGEEQEGLDGIGVYTAMLFQGMTNLGHQVVQVNDGSFLPIQNKHSSLNQIYFNWPFAVSSLANIFLDKPTSGHDKLNQKIDIYHCTDYHQPLLRHIPIVTTLHDAVFLQFPNWCRQPLRKFKNYAICKLAKQAHHVICISHAAKKDIVKHFGIEEKKITVIYHGIDPFWLQRVSTEECQKVLNQYQINSNYLLFTGTIQPRKNIYRLLQAYMQLPLNLQKDLQLVVVGKAGWDQLAIKTLQTLEHQGKVKWLGYINRQALRCLYQGCRLFVFPSLYEGFGLPILEAFASGVPVITSNCSALPEICKNAAILVDPYDVDALRRAIESLLIDSKICTELIVEGKKRLQDFSWEQCLEKTVNVYKTLV